MVFFRSIYLMIKLWWNDLLKQADPPVPKKRNRSFTPPSAPIPPKTRAPRVTNRRPRDPRLGLEYHRFGEVVLIKCCDRHHYRAVTRAINCICGARRCGIDHIRYVRERQIAIHGGEMFALNRALDGASYRELREMAA